MSKIILPTALLTALAACGDPRPLTVDRQDFNEAILDNKTASLLDPTPAHEIPAGTATYQGQFTSSALINDDSGYQVIGDIELVADFGANNPTALDGELDNINLIDRFNRDRENSQELRGSLDIDGVSSLGGFSGNATGELEGVFGNDGFLRSSDLDLDIAGDVVGDTGTTVYGAIDGEGRGGFDIELTEDGAFTANR